MSGQGFEYTPFGMIPIDPSRNVNDPAPGAVNAEPAVMPGAVQVTRPAPLALATTKASAPAPVAAAVTPSGPREVVRAARARVKEIRSELKRLGSLQKELGELERLLKAAREKPTASVRTIRRVG